ncbi:MAG TPA: 4Fe-4S dicluster domain-containing protein [Candidatus Didemnitutus sp.]|jgi:molybdopterin-containing oxidoreductase family iron-sulfur binding subunit
MSSLNPVHSSPPDRAPRATDEFAAGASVWRDGIERRDFLKLMGASLLLAGLPACTRRPPDALVSRADPPGADAIPELQWYATAVPWHGYARGALVRIARGRPILLEGNPDHPESRGALDAVSQAMILSLYDPERSGSPRQRDAAADWDAFTAAWSAQHTAMSERRGARLAILTEPTTSPTLIREIHALLEEWPEARWFQHSAMPEYERNGSVDVDLSQADVLFTIGSDLFYQHPSAIRHVADFTRRRAATVDKHSGLRMHALEATPTLTGMRADRRLAVAPDRQAAVLNSLTTFFRGEPQTTGLSSRESEFVRRLAGDVRKTHAVAVCVVGEEMPAEIQSWANAFNAQFGATALRTRPILRSDSDPACHGGLAEFLDALASAEVAIVLGANPAYASPRAAATTEALKKVPFTVHAGESADETAGASIWHLPEAHFLESWSDLRAYSGEATILQPATRPLHEGRSLAEIVHFLRTGAWQSAYELVRTTWRSFLGSAFEMEWNRALQRGVLAAPTARPDSKSPDFPWPVLAGRAPATGLVVLIRADLNLHDGRWANNAWLQELPRPFTALTWENAVLMAATDARERGLKSGDLVACQAGDAGIEGPVWILPGQAPGCVTVHLGGGRARAGHVGLARGFNAYALQDPVSPWTRAGGSVRATGRRQEFASTQRHFQMEGRDLVREIRPGQTLRSVDAAQPTLLPAWPREGYAWAMSIDLDACFGCNACIVACQAENNIPVVGRDQVIREREMHWIRVDRYFTGEAENARLVHQPVPCMQCENAPCELVCPVGATVHSSEGLNDMVYNRCVGTRYCANNCPYKVRRFNFLDYRMPADSLPYLGANPVVSIRERGVMEKCTYCVQRIDAGRSAAERAGRRVRDGEIQTACQQACPVGAIVFGDLSDPASNVSRRRRDPRSYALLEELGTRPRTTYLARVNREPPGGEGA